MDRLMEDAANIHQLFPWIECDRDIMNYMRKIPLDKSHLRNQLTLLHFLNLKDCENMDNFEQSIENDAREIVLMLPDIAYKLIKERLSILGNMPNRKEAVIRQLLHEKQELRSMVSELDHSSIKRKSDNIIQINNGDQGDETNIKIKIRKVEGSLEVVSSFKQEKVPVSPNSAPMLGVRPDLFAKEPMSSLDEITSSSDSDDLPHSSSSSSTDLSVEIYGNGGYRQFINNTVQKKPANRLMKSLKPATVVNSTMNVQPPPAAVFTRQSQSETTLPNESQHNHPENFNLIEYLKEVTQTSEEKIRSLCKEQGVSPNEKPHVVIINDLLEKIMAEEVIVLDDSSVSNEVTPVPVPMDIPEQACISNGPALPTGENEISPRIKKEKDAPPSTVTADQNGNPSAKECNSRKPVIIRAPRLFIAPEQNSSCEFQPINLSPSKRKLIKPARLNIEPRSPEAIPAMPLPFLDHIRNAANPRQLPEVNEAASGPFAVEHQSDVHNKAVLDLNLPENPEAGPSKKKNRPIEEKLVLRLIEMFPQACPDYIRRVCRGKDWNEFDEVVTVILSAEDYPKRPDRIPSPQKEFDLEEQLEIVKALLPDADPIFLRCKCEEIGNNLEHLNEFIYSLRETKDYPTMKEYLRKQKLSAQSRQYTTEFNVENFVQLFPEPEKTFTDSKRALKIDPYTALYITNFFQNKYDRLPVKTVRSILSHNNFKLIESDNLMIDAINNNQVMRSRRKRQTLTDVPQNINVLQELAYITHKEEIETLLREKKEKEEQDRQNAKENGLMISCQCCYDEEVMVKDSFSCPKDCRFCRDCIQKSCEIALGEGKTEYNCLNDCPEQFTLQTLQNVLPPKMFSKLAQKKTLAEVKAAGIAELEMCPFCDFASIPNETDKIFRCLNPDCMKESCRTCKEENHIPYRCDELEKDEEVKARVHVENKMTEALLRKCWKCGTSFFKEEGCNKMTCTCGAKMCYICKAPVTDYSHFNGIGGDKYHLCPLYSDSNLINQQAVMGAAQAAIAEVDPAKLKVDPTLDVEKHFQERKKALPREAHMDYLGDMQLHNRFRDRMEELERLRFRVEEVGRQGQVGRFAGENDPVDPNVLVQQVNLLVQQQRRHQHLHRRHQHQGRHQCQHHQHNPNRP